MIGLGDVLVDRMLTKDESKSALCALFSLQLEEVFIADDLEQILSMPDSARVLCLMTSLTGGEFRTILSMHEGQFIELPRIPTAIALCKILKCRCAVSDRSLNPYSFLLVGEDGTCQESFWDVERLDEHEEYVIDTSRMVSK